MKKSIGKKVNMYRAVLQVCKAHESSWTGIPGFVSTINDLEAAINNFDTSAELQSSKTIGVSAAKAKKMDELFERLLLLQGALAIHAKTIGNVEMIERNKITYSDLRQFSIAKLNVHLNKVVSDLSQHGNELVPFGITSQFVTDSLSFIEESRSTSGSPRMAIIERKLYTKSLEEQVKEIDDLIKFNLDKMIRLFKKTVPDFYNLYFNARIIIDVSHGKKADPETGPPPAIDDPF